MQLTNYALVIIVCLHCLNFLPALFSEFVYCLDDKLFASDDSSSFLAAKQLQNGVMQVGLPLFILSGLQNCQGSQTIGFACITT